MRVVDAPPPMAAPVEEQPQQEEMSAVEYRIILGLFLLIGGLALSLLYR